jgi:hypothetical protein
MDGTMVQSSQNAETTKNGQKAAESRHDPQSDADSKAGDAQTGEMTDQTADTLDERKAKAASALRDAAQTVRERAGSAPLPGLDRAAEAAVRPLESGATYLEQHSPGDMWFDLMQFCRNHPAGALFLGFGLGYMVKKLLP